MFKNYTRKNLTFYLSLNNKIKSIRIYRFIALICTLKLKTAIFSISTIGTEDTDHAFQVACY